METLAAVGIGAVVVFTLIGVAAVGVTFVIAWEVWKEIR